MGFLKRYRTVIATRAFAITAATGLLILISAVLGLFGAGFWVRAAFSLAGVVVGGLPIVYGAVKGLLRRQFNVDELVAIAIIASVAYREYLSAAFVAFMMLFGKLLEDFTAARARTALADLGKLTPTNASVRRDGQERIVAIDDIVPGDVVIVKAGERISVDGVVLSGQASVNQAPITGESMPVAKVKGSEVYAGTLNELGALEIRADKVGDSTTLRQVVQLVEEAEQNRAPIVRAADRYAKYFTPAILLVALLAYLITRQVNNALSVLIVACPCALVLATPIAIIAGVANGARRGILIKGGARLEAAGRVTAVAIDKTGTLTLGEPNVLKVVSLEGTSESDVLLLAAIAEKLSEHPLGRAVVARAKRDGLELADPDEFVVVPGRGVVARSHGGEIVVGTESLLLERRVTLPPAIGGTIKALEDDGLTPVLVASSGRLVGAIGMADTVRAETGQAIRNLKYAGVRKVVMLTGDSPEVARRIADSIGLDEWHARMLPQDKVEAVIQMQHQGYSVAMLGDGINDAPALAQADVGIAMGVSGTDVAMDTADIVLMTDDVLKASEAIRLSRRTLRLVKQNLAFALVFNLIGIAAAASGVLSPIAAALFHNFGSVAVVVNSARLATSKNAAR